MSKDRHSNLALLLGIDTSNDHVVRDLAAVAITRLAWRDGPIEDWHAAPHQKINDVEMMRANVATTRLVRHVMEQAPEPSAKLFRRIGRAIANERRQLPGGFRVEDLAPRRKDLSLYQAHVTVNVSHWVQSGIHIGFGPIMQILACRAVLNWGWWLSTGYQAMVGKVHRRARPVAFEHDLCRPALPTTRWT